MQVASIHFKERARASLHDEQLQINLRKFQGKFVPARRDALRELTDFEGTREAARAIRQRALDGNASNPARAAKIGQAVPMMARLAVEIVEKGV